jgi:hypothetical protein
MPKKPKIYTVNLTCSNGTVTRIISEKSESPKLEEAQKFVGGYLTMAPIRNNVSDEPIQLLVDEDGLPKQLPFNPNASLTAGYRIYGNALILKGKACWK